MASMATLFAKTPTPSQPLHKSLNTHFTPRVKHAVLVPTRPRGRRSPRVSASLIDPDGGKLVELLVEERLRGEKRREAAGLPRIKLSRINLEWVHVLSEGWASPIRGFMRESEFLQTLHFNALRLDDGSFVNMSVPIVLDIDDAQKRRIGESTRVALVDSADKVVAILNE